MKVAKWSNYAKTHKKVARYIEHFNLAIHGDFAVAVFLTFDVERSFQTRVQITKVIN